MPSALSPIWSGSTCFLPTQKKVGSRISYGKKKIDLSGFDLGPDTLLMHAIAALKYPAAAAIIHKFARAIREITPSQSSRDILNSPLQNLLATDIARLFASIEDAIEKNWAKKYRYGNFLSATAPFKYISEPIGDGSQVGASGFASRFLTDKRKEAKDSAAERLLRAEDSLKTDNSSLKKSGPSSILDSIHFNSFTERNEKSFLASAKRHGEIAGLCQTVLTHHTEVAEKIKTIKSQTLFEMPNGHGGFNRQGLLSRGIYLSLPKDKQLRYLLYLVEKEKWHEITPQNATPYPTDCAIDLFIFKHINDIGTRKEILLSDYFLPEYVVGACCVAIQNATGLNTEVIESLSDNDIEKTKNGYRMVGIKGKTDQVVEREIFENSKIDNEDLAFANETGRLALELLLENAAKIKIVLKQKSIPLLTTLHRTSPRGKTRKFSQVGAYKLILAFCRYNKIQAFDTRYLRELKLQTHSLSPDENIYTSQQLAGHTSAQTTEIYIFTKVLSHLQMANIRRYMDMIAGSILWRTNRTGALTESGLNNRGFNLNLLFPIPNHHTDEVAVIDKWIESGLSSKITIGKDELAQCAIQFEFYRKNIENLPQSNPKYFVEHHLPRMLICLALHKVILTSQFAPIYRAIRRQVYDE